MAHAAIMKIEMDEKSTCEKISKLMQEAISLFKFCRGYDDPMYEKVTLMYQSGYDSHARDYKPLLVEKIMKEIPL